MSRCFTVINAEQRSDAWFAARAGRLTASAAKHVLSWNKDRKESAARRDLRMRLVCERLSGRPVEDDYQANADMRRGMELEPQARTCYMSETGATVHECGFVAHNEHLIGCSPDGIVGDFEGGLEVKCPRPANHLAYLRAGGLPSEHEAQILHSLWVTGAAYWDFVSFCNAFPERLQLFIHRVKRDESAVQAYAEQALKFLAEVETEYRAIQTIVNPAKVLREAI